MRSDLKDNTDTINKMIQFGTVKYGIVKQLKDRNRSERDVGSDHEENGSSVPCSPVVDCKLASPEIEQTILDHHLHHHHQQQQQQLQPEQNDEEHQLHNLHNPHHHNNNISEDHEDHENHHYANSPIKAEFTDTYPEEELNHKIPSPIIHGQQQLQEEQKEHQQQDQQVEQQPQPPHEQQQNTTLHNEDQNDHVMSDGEDDHENSDQSNNQSQNEDPIQCSKGADEQNVENPLHNDHSDLPPQMLPQFPAGPVTLEAIQNMQMAIAQFAAKTLANGGADNEAAMKQLAFLQQTLFNLQQQQLFQIQLIQQLQSQLAMNQMKDDEDGDGIDEDDGEDEEQCNAENLSNQKFEKNQKDDEHESMEVEEEEEEEEQEEEGEEEEEESSSRIKDAMKESEKEGITVAPVVRLEEKNKLEENRIIQKDLPLPLPKQDENTPLPYGSDLASSIITNHDNPPSLDEPNSLEMLQKRAQEVLESASQGILAGNLADEFAFGKDKSGDGKNRNEPFFKHRCRYCGKVFGSDSALQIHIRSHTGERPFKCNVCGSRFTTKGNLKVHFQRHAQKFPHVPMNSTPIPEHLDKFHPPLLEQMSPEGSPQHQSQMPHPNVPVTLPLPFPPGAAFPGLPLYRPPLDILKSLGPYPNPFFGGLPPPLQQQPRQPLPPQPPPPPPSQQPTQQQSKREQEMPTDLRKPPPVLPPSSQPSNSPRLNDELKEEPLSVRIKEEHEAEPDVKRPKSTTPPLPQQQQLQQQPQQSEQHQQHPPQQSPQQQQQQPQSQPPPPPPPPPSLQPQHPQPQPPPITALQIPHPPCLELPPTSAPLPPSLSRDELHDRLPSLPLNFARTSPERRSPICSPANIPRSPFLGPMKHEMTLLPRPHSNDNSWENFIEVSNTSETVKLKELMKNKKITDPNQCVVCDRVLSCKSALQMHYRTHTGERPFKCRICGRAFTTKGNLKTHMAVHKIRPPMRNFHQCPVCHKKYSNALVLQQHIRLHTGEPTDLTPEQIQAAEIRDFPPSMVPGSFLNPFTFNFGMNRQNGTLGSESSHGENDENMDCSDDFDDDVSDHLSNGGDSDRPKSRDDIKGMLFDQKLKIENNRPKSEASNSSAPTSPVSAINKLSPAPSDTSQGALDLTPRSGGCGIPLPHSPAAFLPARPPFGMFPNLPLFPPVSTTTHNMCSAMNSIAQSVMPSAPFNPLALSGVRGSTTCGICFKTFPCHSALEIHYRSHTKERPFKCTICDRGFTTKGNLKQHMLTHKIRDMEQDAFRNRAVKYMNNWKDEYE